MRLLSARARRLNSARLPAVLLFTDPVRTCNPLHAARALPPGAGIVYRHFGAPDRLKVGADLARLCARRKLTLLVGADARLARRIKAKGVHLPERSLSDAIALRRAHPRWIITGAAHSSASLARAADAKLDAAMLSPVFPSASASAGAALGLRRAAALARAARLPVFALGGVNARTTRLLAGRSFTGLAGVSFEEKTPLRSGRRIPA